MARMLNMYQLWLDDLYPRAKFLDGLAMVEKLGHKKRLQVMRKQWIDEGKPKLLSLEDEEMLDDMETSHQEPDPIFPAVGSEPEREHGDNRPVVGETADEDAPDADELDALLAAEGDAPESSRGPDPPQSIFGNGTSAQEEDAGGPDEDELDALLAEGAPSQRPPQQSLFGDGTPAPKATAPQPEDDHADDLAAMAEMEGW
jgi:replication fork protection complex subunit Csm3/Swi3